MSSVASLTHPSFVLIKSPCYLMRPHFHIIHYEPEYKLEGKRFEGSLCPQMNRRICGHNTETFFSITWNVPHVWLPCWEIMVPLSLTFSSDSMKCLPTLTAECSKNPNLYLVVRVQRSLKITWNYYYFPPSFPSSEGGCTTSILWA